MPQPAIRHGESNAAWFGDTYSDVHNLTGWPAAVVRGGTSPDGLPIGVQLVAQPWREDVALAGGAGRRGRTRRLAATSALRPTSTVFVARGRRWEGAGEHRKRAHPQVRERGAQSATPPASFTRDSR